MNMASERQYEFIILGATGYTGRNAVEYVYSSLPTNLKWAVAGRTASKLVDLVERMQKVQPDRRHPGMLLAECIEDL